eukprot:165421-Amphidinium_carterae.1
MEAIDEDYEDEDYMSLYDDNDEEKMTTATSQPATSTGKGGGNKGTNRMMEVHHETAHAVINYYTQRHTSTRLNRN